MTGLDPTDVSQFSGRLRGVLSLPLRIAAFVAERCVSGRGLIIGFFLAAAWFSTAPWIRPPFSHDIGGLHLPIGIGPGGLPVEDFLHPHSNAEEIHGATASIGASAEEILNGPRRLFIDSIGMFLLAIIAVVGIAALWRPRCFGVAAGLLLIASLGANAAALLNHPRLIYLLDLELEQRSQIARLFWFADDNPAINNFNDRISGQPASTMPTGLLTSNAGPNWAPSLATVYLFLPYIEEERGGWERALLYIRWGPYLVLLAFFGVLMGVRGTLSRRFRHTAVYAVLGIVLASGVCFPRLRAEYYWQNAKVLEARCDFEGARTALKTCYAASPAFEEREQAWLMAGKIDDAENKHTASRELFRAFQAYRPKPRPGPMGRMEDLPAWPTTMTRDSREWRWAVGSMETILGGQEVPRPVAVNQMARLWTQVGLMYYLQQPKVTELGFQYLRRQIVLMSALEAWRRATTLSPVNLDVYLYEGLALARTDRDEPQRVRGLLQPMFDGLADRPVRADILATLGDCYLESGNFREALPFYKQSADEYTLPKIVNHRSFKGLGGW
jgi:tetratricopeptide (TPR) repeat protein